MFRLETGNDMHSSSQFDSSQFAKYQKYCIVNCDCDDAFILFSVSHKCEQ